MEPSPNRRNGSGLRHASDVTLATGRRRHLIALMFDALQGGQLGALSKMAGLSWELMMRLGGSRVIQHYRAPFDAAVTPFVGDILLYLARGEKVRSFIADRVARVEPPVVLVGHSLGGIACLDLLAERILSQGTSTATLISPREFFREALRFGATTALAFHNHPSGDPTPSEADIKVTRDLIRAGHLLKIEVDDHLILGRKTSERDQDYVSLRELGYFYT